MHNYQLIRNHYVVTVDGCQYLIDTGSPVSMNRSGSITIDGKTFSTHRISDSMLAPMSELIGGNIDGLIGLDILRKTSLTIYKDGRIDFGLSPIGGAEVPFAHLSGGYIRLPCTLEDGRKAVALIDTGAMIYYGDYSGFFAQKGFVGEFDDYNPTLGKMRSRFYTQTIEVAGRTITVPVGDNAGAVSLALKALSAAIVMNITELFDEVFAFDFVNCRVILK